MFLLFRLRVRQARFRLCSPNATVPQRKILARIVYKPRSEVGTMDRMGDFPTRAFVFNYDGADLDGG